MANFNSKCFCQGYLIRQIYTKYIHHTIIVNLVISSMTETEDNGMELVDIKEMIDSVDYAHGIPSLAGYLSKKVMVSDSTAKKSKKNKD